MKIDSKFVYVKKKVDFEPLISSIPENLDPIVFIEDTKEIWTCGTYFSINYPDPVITETGGLIKIVLGDVELNINSTGESISLRKSNDNTIVIDSNALTQILTESPLEWTSDKKLIHSESGVKAGSYGPSSNATNANIVQIPQINVNVTGHIVSAETRSVQLRDYVEQAAPTGVSASRPILLSYSDNEQAETAQVRKAKGLTYNDATQVLTVPGGITSNGDVNITGNLEVVNGYIVGKFKGDVDGQAIPKVHISAKPEYGGASTKMYGHVIVQDEVPETEPDPSSDNEDTTNTKVVAVAASPLMVWKAMQRSNGIVVTAPSESGEVQDLSKKLEFSNDFISDKNNKLYINWIELNG